MVVGTSSTIQKHACAAQQRKARESTQHATTMHNCMVRAPPEPKLQPNPSNQATQRDAPPWRVVSTSSR
eukprot:7647399-Prorocentrum_lima.AAC.1